MATKRTLEEWGKIIQTLYEDDCTNSVELGMLLKMHSDWKYDRTMLLDMINELSRQVKRDLYLKQALGFEGGD